MINEKKKETQCRYAIGIDLGTSNCALAYIDLANPASKSKILEIPQWETADRSIERQVLPSFAYYPTVTDSHKDIYEGWQSQQIVGIFARAIAAQLPQRVIHSAKSWLCHSGINREAKILPWSSTEIDLAHKLSPVAASALFLNYLSVVWDQKMALNDNQSSFHRQQITITVPASFEQDAQKLTLKAAQLAGYPETVGLLEEPQAAFHAWIENNPDKQTLVKLLPPKETQKSYQVLVCDIGGGTSDFSLFSISFDKQGEYHIKRLAVSDHILLGGDNIDFALAKIAETQIAKSNQRLSSRAWQSLISQSRALKERALSIDEPDETEYRMAISEGGSNLFAQAKSATLTHKQIIDLLNQGFFPQCEKNEQPQYEQSGLQEMGLPYPTDPAITKYLAEFLSGHGVVDAVIFNGGVLTPDYLRQHLLSMIADWQDGYKPIDLENQELHLAVAKGAAHFAQEQVLARKRLIEAGAAQGFYLELGAHEKKEQKRVVCILPQGTAVECKKKISKIDLQLTINKPVEFRPYSSTRRRNDHPGQILRYYRHDFKLLPPLQTIAQLQSKKNKLNQDTIPIILEAQLNALGLLQVFLVSAHRKIKPVQKWELEFNLRTTHDELSENVSNQEETTESLPEDMKQDLIIKLNTEFNLSLLKELEKIIGRKKNKWNRTWLRQLWEPLYKNITQRHLNPDYEAAWLHAAGYFLRPGYGVSLDDYRIKNQLWCLHDLELDHPQMKSVREQYFVMWRRVAGGLDQEQQIVLYDEILFLIKSHVKQAHEAIRMVSSFEYLPLKKKKELFTILLEGVEKKLEKHCDPYLWALGRLLSRISLYAGPEWVMPPDYIDMCFQFLKPLDWTHTRLGYINSLFSLAARKTDHRSIDIADGLRQEIVAKMEISQAKEKQIKQVREYIPVAEEDLNILFGESLPSGLTIGQY